ncbi:MAG TPA: heavy-metal-associated domain-containing protein [Steroidobacteraceae bacterium]|jgi:copper chaperone CopZ
MYRKLGFALIALLVATAASAATIEMKVHGLVCGFCAQGIEKILRKNPATDGVVVSLEHKLVVVTTKQGTDISDAELTRAITEAGYTVKGIERTSRTLDEVRRQTLQASNQ